MDTLRKFPLTIVLSSLTIAMYYLGFGSDRCSLICPLDWQSNDWTRFILHPFIHSSPIHLYGNVFGLLIVGYLIEDWMKLYSRKECYVIFPIAFGISYLIDFFLWHVQIQMAFNNVAINLLTQHPANGMSLVVYGLSAFPLVYYFAFSKQIVSEENWNIYAPILIGIIFGPSLLLIVELFVGVGGVNAIYHVAAFFVSFIIARRFFR